VNDQMSSAEKGKRWTFITNHAMVFMYVAEHPDATIRQIATDLGLGWRTVAGILHDLRKDNYVLAFRVGKGNLYRVDSTLTLRKGPYSKYTLEEFFTILRQPPTTQPPA